MKSGLVVAITVAMMENQRVTKLYTANLPFNFTQLFWELLNERQNQHVVVRTN